MKKITYYADIGVGDRVEMLVPGGRDRFGQIEWAKRQGRAVMRGPAGWVLNGGGPHGTPLVCEESRFVRIVRKAPGAGTAS